MVSLSLENINTHSVRFILFLNGDVLFNILTALRVVSCITTLWPQQKHGLIVTHIWYLQTIVIDHSEVQCMVVHLRKNRKSGKIQSMEEKKQQKLNMYIAIFPNSLQNHSYNLKAFRNEVSFWQIMWFWLYWTTVLWSAPYVSSFCCVILFSKSKDIIKATTL